MIPVPYFTGCSDIIIVRQYTGLAIKLLQAKMLWKNPNVLANPILKSSWKDLNRQKNQHRHQYTVRFTIMRHGFTSIRVAKPSKFESIFY